MVIASRVLSGLPSWLEKERIIAAPDFDRWLVPPAALAIHLCIGMAYGFSVFWLPLTRALGIRQSIPCGPNIGLWGQLFTTTCDWSISTLGWLYTLFFVFLGLSAAVWGSWLERVGPRKAGVVSALCWCGGLLISALGVHLHQFWVMLVGSGVIGGVGLGLGYISPVSTLIKWFPDRKGMAAGLAIMGFGGGAMVGSPFAADLMARFATATDVGVAKTLIVLALVSLVFMMAGAFGYRIPPPGWRPKLRSRAAVPSRDLSHDPSRDPSRGGSITRGHVHASKVWRIPQFWLLWIMLC
ncbi:MAG: MFS transporter, partial [Betaproteobacteria bacterium]|nr:MFS transporter [Betaproteobacteria bacterium]